MSAKLLVVDDDRLVLATLADGLRRAGFEVVTADNGDDAILASREERPALALLDIRMEGKSGFDVARYLNAQGRVPFVFLSAFDDAETRAEIEALGALDSLAKPIDMRALVPAIERALACAAEAAPRASRGGSALDGVSPVVAMAAGVLMARDRLDRDAALARVESLARGAGQSIEATAERIVSS